MSDPIRGILPVLQTPVAESGDFDIESLADYGLTLKTLPLMRRQFTDHIAIHRTRNPLLFSAGQ